MTFLDNNIQVYTYLFIHHDLHVHESNLPIEPERNKKNFLSSSMNLPIILI